MGNKNLHDAYKFFEEQEKKSIGQKITEINTTLTGTGKEEKPFLGPGPGKYTEKDIKNANEKEQKRRESPEYNKMITVTSPNGKEKFQVRNGIYEDYINLRLRNIDAYKNEEDKVAIGKLKGYEVFELDLGGNKVRVNYDEYKALKNNKLDSYSADYESEGFKALKSYPMYELKMTDSEGKEKKGYISYNAMKALEDGKPYSSEFADETRAINEYYNALERNKPKSYSEMKNDMESKLLDTIKASSPGRNLNPDMTDDAEYWGLFDAVENEKVYEDYYEQLLFSVETNEEREDFRNFVASQQESLDKIRNRAYLDGETEKVAYIDERQKALTNILKKVDAWYNSKDEREQQAKLELETQEINASYIDLTKKAAASGEYKRQTNMKGTINLKKLTSAQKYDAINLYRLGGLDNRLFANGQVPSDMLWAYLEDEEVKIYNKCYAISPETAEEYLKELEPVLKMRKSNYKSEESYNYGKEHPILGGLNSAVTDIFVAPIAGLENAIEGLTTGEVDTYDDTSIALRQSQAMRAGGSEYMSENYGAMAQFAYDTGLSILENAAVILTTKGIGSAAGLSTKAVSGIASASMAMSAASNQMISIADRGGNSTQILLGGLAAGAAEYLFEKFSVESLLKPSSGKLVMDILKQSGVEASEEMFTEVANIISDTVIMGQNSESEIMRRKLILEDGLSADEATKEVFFKNLDQVLQAGASGAISGGVMSGGKTIINNATYNHRINTVSKDVAGSPTALDAVVRLGNEIGNGEAKYIGELMQEGITPDAKQVRTLVESVAKDGIEKDASLPGVVKTIAAIEGRNSDYIGSQEAIDTANAVLKMANGTATETDYALIERSEGARTVVLAADGTKAWDSLKAEADRRMRSAEYGVRNETPAKSDVKYKIAHTTENKPVVVIENDILDGVPKNDWVRTAKDAIKKFRPEIPISGRFVKVNKVTGNEYTKSKYTEHIRKADAVKYQDKLTAAGNLDEIVIASTQYVNEGLNHSRKDNIKDFARGNVLLEVGGRQYSAEVIIGTKSNGEMLLYDVINLDPQKFDIKKKMNSIPDTSGTRVTSSENSSSTDSISEDNPTVNSKDMRDGEKDARSGKKVPNPEEAKKAKNVDNGIVVTEESKQLKKENLKAYNNIGKLASSLNTRAVVVRGLVNKKGEALAGQLKGGVIYVNADVGAEKISRWAALHEASHLIKQKSEKIWQRFENYAIKRLEDTGEYEDKYEAKKEHYEAAEINEELACDFIGDMFESEEELTEFIRTDKSFAVKVRDFFYNALSRMGLFGERKKAQALWLKAYKEAMKNANKVQNAEYGMRSESKESKNGTRVNDVETSEGDKIAGFNKNSLIKKIQKNLETLSKEDVILSLDTTIFNDKNVNIVDQVLNFFDSLGNKVYRTGFGEVALDKKGIKSCISHKLGRAKCIAFRAVPDIIKYGKQIDYQQKWKGRPYDSYVFAGKVKIGDEEAYVGVIVTQSKNTNEYYLHEIVDNEGNFIIIKNDEVVPNKTVSKTDNSLHGGTTSSADNSVSQDTPTVNTNSMQNGENYDKEAVLGTRAEEGTTSSEIATQSHLPLEVDSPMGEMSVRTKEARPGGKASDENLPKPKYTDRYSREKLKNRIDSDFTYLHGMLADPTDKRHVPEHLQAEVAAVLDCIKFETKQLDKIKDAGKEAQSPTAIKLAGISGLYEDIIRKAWGVEKNGNSKLLDEYLSEDLLELKESIPVDESGEFKRLQDMSTEELRVIGDVLRGIHHAVTKSNQAFTEGIKTTIDEASDNVVAEMATTRGKRKGSGQKLEYGKERGLGKVIGAIDKFMNVDMLQPWDMFHKIGGTMEKIFGENRKAFDRHIVNLQKASDAIKKAIGKLDVKKMTGKGAKISTFDLSDGSSIKVDKGQLLSLYALYKRPQGKEHILSGGIVTGRKATDSSGNKVSGNEIHKVSETDLGKMFETLSAEEKKMVDDIVRFMSKECAAWGNEASMKLYDYEKYGEGWYFPIKVADTTLQTWSGSENEGNLRTQSFTKKLVKNAGNAIVISDFFDTVASHINGMSLYNTIALPMLDMERVLNHKSEGETVRQAIDITYGKAVNRYINKWLEDVNGSKKITDEGGLTNTFFKNAKKASIGMNLRVLLQQPTSIMRALQFMNPVDLAAAAKALVHPSKTIKEMQKHVPIAYWKSLGFRDVGVGSSLKDAIIDNESAYDKVAMGGYGLADDATWSLIYTAVKNEVQRKNPDIEVGSDAYWEKVVDRFNYIVDRSQVVDSVFHRSQIMRNERDFVKNATMFMSEPIKQLNMYRTEIEDAIKSGSGKEAAKKLSRATAVYMFSNLILALVQALPDAWREDDDKELYDKNGKKIPFWDIYMKKLGIDFKDDVNPLNGIPYVKDLISIIQGYSMDRVEYSSLVKTVNAIKALDNDKVPLPTRIYNVFKNGAPIFGFAPGNLVRDFEGITKSIMRGFGDEYTDYTLTKTKWDVSNPSNESKFMKHYERALKNGNAEDAQLILGDYLQSVFKGKKFNNEHSKDVLEEVTKLYGKTKSDSKLVFGIPEDSFSYDGKKTVIPENEYDEYVEGYYNILWKTAYDFVKSEEYKNLSDEDKVRSFGEIKGYAANAQRMESVDGYELTGWKGEVYSGETDFIDSVLERKENREYQDNRDEYKDTFEYDASKYTPEEISVIEEVESDAASYYSAVEMGRDYNESDLRHIQVYDDYISDKMEIEEYAGVRAYAKKTAAMADGKETMKKDELKAYLDSTDYSQEMKAALFEAIGNKGWKNPYTGGKIGDGVYFPVIED